MKLHALTTTYTPPEEDAAEIEVTIYYTYLAGSPATGPTYSSGGEQACPAEVEFDHADPSTPEIEDWAREWIQDGGYDRACEEAEEDLMPDPDAAYEARRDRDMENGR
jgi:hypothetical protein